MSSNGLSPGATPQKQRHRMSGGLRICVDGFALTIEYESFKPQLLITPLMQFTMFTGVGWNSPAQLLITPLMQFVTLALTFDNTPLAIHEFMDVEWNSKPRLWITPLTQFMSLRVPEGGLNLSFWVPTDTYKLVNCMKGVFKSWGLEFHPTTVDYWFALEAALKAEVSELHPTTAI